MVEGVRKLSTLLGWVQQCNQYNTEGPKALRLQALKVLSVEKLQKGVLQTASSCQKDPRGGATVTSDTCKATVCHKELFAVQSGWDYNTCYYFIAF